jgi:hypothetical protein
MVVIGDDNVVTSNSAFTFIDVGLGIRGDGNLAQKNVLRDGEGTMIVDGDNVIEKNTAIGSYGIHVEGGRSLLRGIGGAKRC